MSKLAVTTSTGWSTPFKSSTGRLVTMNKPITPSDAFTTAMQQLSAEAKKSIPAVAMPSIQGVATSGAVSQAIEARIDQMEENLSKKIDQVARIWAQNRNTELSLQFHKIEEQLAAIRNSETVNQRLFDSLHDELLKYRDNFVHESLQKPFIHDLVHLFDDLTSLASQLGPNPTQNQKTVHMTQWRENLENSIHSLIEILHRFDVKEVEPRDTVDRTLHKVVSYEPADYAEDDGRIVMRVKRGFVWRDNLIRPEEVIAKRYG
jgi:molecular chaperone GrpE (heat shock protein)